MSIDVPAEKARAVVDAMERDMLDKLATKADLAYTRELLAKDLLNLETRMDGRLAKLEHSLTMRMAGMFTAAVAVLGALQKWL